MTEKDKKKNTTDWQQAKESLSQVFWIGGATTAGKSTIAAKLADDFDMIHYSSDLRGSEHRARATEKEYPAVYAGAEGGMESFRRVLLQPPDKIAEMMRDIRREKFRMVVEDLLSMADDRAVVAELNFGETIGELR